LIFPFYDLLVHFTDKIETYDLMSDGQSSDARIFSMTVKVLQ